MCNQRAGSKKQRITWQKRRNHKTGLRKNDEEKDEIRPALILLRNPDQVFVNMKDEIYKGFDQFQSAKILVYPKVNI